MVSASKVHVPSSIEEDLRAATCLLALISKRPQDLDRLLVRDNGSDHGNDGDHTKGLISAKTESPSISDVYAEDHEEDPEVDPEEDLEINDIDMGGSNEADFAALKTKLLDRLAETLARFKSDIKGQRGSPTDPKHVSSTMMIVYHEPPRVKLLCAKNEGLDQEGTTEDTEFLESWRKCMECISKTGPAVEEANASLFTLVVNYQRPRIIYYLKQLQEAFAADDTNPPLPTSDVKLSEAWLRKQPKVKVRTWIDDNENEYKISIGSSTGSNAESDAAVSGDSLRNINVEASAILDRAHKLCLSIDTNNVTEAFTNSQESELKELMAAVLDSWKSVRHQSALKTRLRSRFYNLKQGNKRQRTIIMALKFLSRIYLAVKTFIDAAENMPMFQSVECLPVTVPPLQLQHGLSQETPLEVIERLGITITSGGWTDFLQQRHTLATFQRMRKQKRFMHAELQTLYHHDTSYALKSEEYQAHPYIGCSKYCCLLCYGFILVHGGFRVRGTHETIIHKWDLPVKFPTAASQAKFRSATQLLLNMAINILQNLFQKRSPLAHLELRAQSSAALSTAQTVHDRELGQMEKSQQNFRRLMTMPMIMNDAVMINDILEKPGFAYVIGGTLGKGQEMTLQEAELYKENHIRSKLGLEKQEEMPPKQESTERKCRRCGGPPSFRCSACRTKYCSKSCQRKDWKRHVFVCSTRNRPNDFDRLWIFLSRRSSMQREDAASSQLLVDLFSDDHLCRTFGFVHCLNFGDVENLLCLYGHFLRTFKSASGPLMVGEENIGNFMELWATLIDQDTSKHTFGDCPCIQWFLQKRATSFEIPDWDAQYIYQGIGLRMAEHNFSLPPADDDPEPLSPGENAVVSLYSQLFRPFNNVPDIYSAEWANFGFCFCTSWDQRKRLANAYLELAESGASLSEIVQAWPRLSLSKLMKYRGMDLSYFEANGIFFQRPNIDDFSIYRLMAEVSHTMSGRFCFCFRPKDNCWNHLKHESHLSRESDADYGFHGTNPWERWQLLTFYNHIFQHPGFNARKMQQAKQDLDNEALEQYLDSLVPNFRKKIGNMYLADAMFPKLRGNLRFPNGRPPCFCVLHSTVASEGLDWKLRWGHSRVFEGSRTRSKRRNQDGS